MGSPDKIMPVALFGGTGFVGSEMREVLLDAGYRVRCLVRSSAGFSERPGLEWIRGDLSSDGAVDEVLDGCDVCIVMTGARTGTKENMQQIVDGTQRIVERMPAQGIRRLLKLSGVSVRVGKEPFPLPRRILDLGLGLAMRYPSRSKYLEQEIIEASALDWVVVRPPLIFRGAGCRSLRAHDHAFLGMHVHVRDLCQFFLNQIANDEWLGKCPTVGYGPVWSGRNR